MTTQSNAGAEASMPVPPEAQLMQVLGGCFQPFENCRGV